MNNNKKSLSKQSNIYKRGISISKVKMTISMCFQFQKFFLIHSTYLCFNAQSSPMNNEWLFGKLIKSVLPLTRELSKCSLCDEQYTTGGEGRK